MQKPNLFSIPNFILFFLVIFVTTKAYFGQKFRTISNNTYSDLYFELFCVNNLETVKSLTVYNCSDLSNFASGIVFGLGNFSQEFKSEFKSFGIIHLVVASGTQINYLYRLVENSLVTIGIIKKIRFLALLIACLAMSIVIGYSAPIIRASVFVLIITFINTFLGQFLHPLRALGFTYIIMLAFSSSYLISYSFWLSILASLAITLAKNLENDIIPNILIENILVIVFLLPIFSHFGTTFNFLSILLNIALSFVMPYLIIIVFLSLLPILSYYIGFFAVAILAIITNLISAFDTLVGDGLTVQIVRFDNTSMAIYYGLLSLIFCVLYFCRRDLRFDKKLIDI